VLVYKAFIDRTVRLHIIHADNRYSRLRLLIREQSFDVVLIATRVVEGWGKNAATHDLENAQPDEHDPLRTLHWISDYSSSSRSTFQCFHAVPRRSANCREKLSEAHSCHQTTIALTYRKKVPGLSRSRSLHLSDLSRYNISRMHNSQHSLCNRI
jgi:hypothetical protein